MVLYLTSLKIIKQKMNSRDNNFKWASNFSRGDPREQNNPQMIKF